MRSLFKPIIKAAAILSVMPKKSLPKQSFEDRYPNISRWVNRENGIIEIGWRDDGYSSALEIAIAEK